MTDTEMLKAMAEMLDPINQRLDSIENNVTDIRLHLENVTDKNISILAENDSNLVRKLDENNKITDTQLAYQIKMNYLIEQVEKLENKIA